MTSRTATEDALFRRFATAMDAFYVEPNRETAANSLNAYRAFVESFAPGSEAVIAQFEHNLRLAMGESDAA